jgi:signal transduction histidine kinase
MLAQDVADRPESARTVQKIVGGVKRVEELVSQVLHFTREINAHPSTCDVVEIVEEAIDLAKGRASAAVRFEIGLPTQLKANVDSRLLSQCVLNLVLNAVEAVGTEGVVRVTLATTEGKAFTLIIEDDGPGIAADVLDRIFNPFFTTKDEGTGLGLSIVHRIVEAHNGTISATNRPSGGAKFEIRI